MLGSVGGMFFGMGITLLSPVWEKIRSFQRERLRKKYEEERQIRLGQIDVDDSEFDLNRKTFFHDWFSLSNIMKRSDEKVSEEKKETFSQRRN